MGVYKEAAAATRQNIMDAFWELYCEKRIEQITVKAIMQKAGYNRGTFYKYFLDAYDVLEQIEASLLPDLSEMPPLVPQAELAILPVDLFIKLYSGSKKYYTVLLGDHGDPSFAAKMKNGIKAKILAQLGANGRADIEMDYTLEYMLSAMTGILTYWFLHDENVEKEKLIQLMYALMNSDGIRALAEKIEL